MDTVLATPTTSSWTLRGAQALLLLPLGALQLAAVIAFTVGGDLTTGGYIVATWAAAMDVTAIAVALRLGRGTDFVWRAAWALLAAQVAFSLVKLTVYGESASFVFLALTAVAGTLLALARR